MSQPGEGMQAKQGLVVESSRGASCQDLLLRRYFAALTHRGPS